MPNISDIMQPYTDSIYRALEKRQRRKSRRLGGSQIGEKCNRKLWYKFRHVKQESFDGRVLRTFETGHEQEARIIAEMVEAGHKVEYVGDNQIEFTWCNGHFVDKPDGIVNGKYPQDIKTMNEKNFKKTYKDGPSLKYLCQMALHIEGAIENFLVPKTAKGLFIAVNKNDESFYEKKIARNSRVAKSLIEKAEMIINAPYPPGRLSDDPSFYECKYCDLWELCHKGGEFDFSCRSCVFSDPVENGEWYCSKYDKNVGYGFFSEESLKELGDKKFVLAPNSCDGYQQIENR